MQAIAAAQSMLRFRLDADGPGRSADTDTDIATVPRVLLGVWIVAGLASWVPVVWLARPTGARCTIKQGETCQH